ncbi:phosphatidylglycerophosphatase A, partial [Acidobacteriota bacterium]
MTTTTRDTEFFLDRISLLFATGFFSGYFPVAPGTFATLVCIPIVLLLKMAASPLVYPAATLGLL